MKSTSIILCAVLLIAGRLHAVAAERFEGKLKPCTVKDLDSPVLCGDMEVWENRAAESGRRIPIHVAVLPALSESPAPDPVFFFEGGPGFPGTLSVKEMGELLKGLRSERDIVFFDQRGTGRSHALACDLPGNDEAPQDYLSDLFPADPLRACLPKLQADADLLLYTTTIAMDDVDDLRKWLGYERINVYGISYGSRAAQSYLRQHESHVRSVVLMGVVPMNDKMPLPFARFAQVSLDRILDDCVADAECRKAFPDVRGDLKHVLAELDKGPVRASIAHPKTGKPLEVRLTRSIFSAALRSMLYYGDLYPDVPLFIHSAATGDYSLIARRAYDYGKENDDWSIGLYLSITCAEDVSFIDMRDVPGAIAGTFLTDDRIRQQVEACSFWPRAKLAPGFQDPVSSAVPVLLLSGWMDPVTPPEQAAEVARHFPNSLHVVARDAGHGPFGLENEACVWNILGDFVRSGFPYGLNTDCLKQMHHHPFRLKPESPTAN